MKVLMLGWEYPPYVSGGLGTACKGLTVGLARQGVEIDFVLPKVYGEEAATHMRLIDANRSDGNWALAARSAGSLGEEMQVSLQALGVSVHEVPALLAPYMTAEQYAAVIRALEDAIGSPNEPEAATHPIAELRRALASAGVPASPGRAPDGSVVPVTEPSPVSERVQPQHYGRDLFSEVQRYAARLARSVVGDWQVIHAHDWMTYPAAIALAQRSGRPLVVHVHSLEQDRSGDYGNPRIIAIEHAGLHAATKIIAVSHYTRSMIQRIHGINPDKIEVVHNGVYMPTTVAAYKREVGWEGQTVLFLGRITFQKGPDYFVNAAAQVVKSIEDVRFVMAGTGDMLPQIMAQVEHLGLRSHFYFPGFLQGEEVERMYSLADVYVMPSVSEPFGITALEAMSYNRPVIVSRQSGVAELMRHALKVDFWDVDQLSNQITAVLKYPELRQAIVASAGEEVRRVHWDAAAKKTLGIYGTVIEAA